MEGHIGKYSKECKVTLGRSEPCVFESVHDLIRTCVHNVCRSLLVYSRNEGSIRHYDSLNNYNSKNAQKFAKKLTTEILKVKGIISDLLVVTP